MTTKFHGPGVQLLKTIGEWKGDIPVWYLSIEGVRFNSLIRKYSTCFQVVIHLRKCGLNPHLLRIECSLGHDNESNALRMSNERKRVGIWWERAAWARSVALRILSPACLEGINPVWSLWIREPIMGVKSGWENLPNIFTSMLRMELGL